MIEHIVLFRCKKETSHEIKNGFIAAARGMPSVIPEILHFSAGENWSERSDGYELALTCRFVDKETLAIYQNHPVHQTFIQEWVKPNIEKVLAVDYFLD